MKKTVRSISITLIAIIMLTVATVSVNAAGNTKTAPAKYMSTKKAYTELNKTRKSKKLKKLKKDKKLEKIAKIRAKEIAKKKKFSHTRPNGKPGLSLIKGNVYKGENIAMGQNSCREVNSDWYKSPGHRANMLRKQFKKVGIACYRYKGVKYWVAVFSS